MVAQRLTAISGIRKFGAWPLLTLLFGLLLSSTCFARLEAKVDRTEISENESVELKLSTRLNITSSLNLFNLNTLSIPQPDVSSLEKDFEILDRQQSYQVQIINSQNRSVITWTYTLIPKTKGDVTIPALEYEGEQSEPIALKVREANSQSPENRGVFLEAEADTQEVYVQQQVIFKVRLFYSLDLTRGELEQPDHPDARFTPLGKQKEYTRYVGNQNFNVIERTYAVFPEAAGELTIPALNFSGSFIKRRYGKRIYHKDKTKPVTIRVKSPPSGFSGTLWLPAQSLSIRDVWSNPAREINVGDSLTRNIQILALGLEGVQLPPLHTANTVGLKIYPEPGKTETEEHAAGVSGTREEMQALIATTPGTYRLPEIKIPWWDVNKNEERVAILPGRVITVLGNPATADNRLNGRQTPAVIPPATATPSLKTEDTLTAQASQTTDQYDTSDNDFSFWKIASATLLVLWFITLYLLWRKPSQIIQTANSTPAPPASMTFERLMQLAKQGTDNFVHEFNRWLNTAHQEGSIDSRLAATIRNATKPALNALQRRLYGPEQANSLDTESAVNLLKKVKELMDEHDHQSRHELTPLYPTR